MVTLPTNAELGTATLDVAKKRRQEREEMLPVAEEAMLVSPTELRMPMPGLKDMWDPNNQWMAGRRERAPAGADPGAIASVGLGFVPGEGIADMSGLLPVDPLDPSKGMRPSAMENFFGENPDRVEGGLQLLGGLADGLIAAGAAVPPAAGAGIALGGVSDALQAYRKGLRSAEDVVVQARQQGKLAQLADLAKRSGDLPKLVEEMKAASAYDDFSVAPVVRDAARAASSDVRKVANASALEGVGFRTIQNMRHSYAPEDGWSPIEVTGGSYKKLKNGSVAFEPKVRPQPYGFEVPPEGVSRETWAHELSEKLVGEVSDVVTRARAGDEKAIAIVQEAQWYRAMRTRLRTEFGGLGDLFADLLGATSPNTPVRDNWNNAIGILQRYSRGDFDKEITAFTERMKTGGDMNPTVLQRLHGATPREFPLITQATGQLFGINSPGATLALLGIFRDVKAGRAPKALNFAGNLIGFSDRATIDVWAARTLRRLAGKPRIPPPAEQSLRGDHLGAQYDKKTGELLQPASTLEEPQIGGEFGFGQDVFNIAANKINGRGIVADFDPELGAVGDDDLQAIVWFMEKERWTENGWTTKAGEGGSFDAEASVAGVSDRMQLSALRKQAEASFKPPVRRQGESDIAYSARLEASQKLHEENVATAKAQLGEIAQPLDRYAIGLSAERPENIPSNYQQAEMAATLDDAVRNDPNVVGYNLANSEGLYDKYLERSLNGEFIVRGGYDSAPLMRAIATEAKRTGQESAFLSKVLRADDGKNARPGVEIYFTRPQSRAEADKVIAYLRKKGVDGFTLVTDARANDRVNAQIRGGTGTGDARETAPLVGLRMQYVPEFDPTFSQATRDKILKAKVRMMTKAIEDIKGFDPNVSSAYVSWYDTKWMFRDNGDYDAVIGGGQ